MNHLHPEDPIRDYTRAELEIFGDRLTWESCTHCGAKGVSKMHGLDVFDVIKKAGFDDMRIPKLLRNPLNNSLTCRKCSAKRSKELDANLKPKYARRLLKSVRAMYKCPLCDFVAEEKSMVFHHIVLTHDRYQMEEQLNRRHVF